MNDQMTSTRREAYNALANLLTALGAGLGVWGVINLLEGCGNNHPAAKEQGGTADKSRWKPRLSRCLSQERNPARP